MKAFGVTALDQELVHSSRLIFHLSRLRVSGASNFPPGAISVGLYTESSPLDSELSNLYGWERVTVTSHLPQRT